MTDNTEDWARCLKCGWEWPIGTGDASAYGKKHGSKGDIKNPPSVRCPFCGSGRWKEFKEKL
jgi:DNA-directed RNA polymerase subunit RPC12/RpoP